MTKDLEVAILFADVVGSTQLYDKYGDTKASETVAHCLEVMKDATYQFDGTVIKTIGDEVMSTFPTVDDAMGAAAQMQSRISAESEEDEDRIPVSIRIGCHFGPVVQEQNDIFGAAVHTANRMTSQAKAKQIVMSGATVEQMTEKWQAQTRQIDIATVRGRIDEVALYELLWQPDEATSMVPTLEMTSKKKNGTRLILTFRDKTVEVNDKRVSINLGRGDDNDLVVKGNLISRIHAKIEKRRGKYLLIDQSTNGTFLQSNSGEETFVRRDNIELKGEGIIGLGRVAKPDSPLAIHYVCEES
ncbi:MAG: adenylate/guanylate cyclase domain-containing protein [Woeseiaceae bacterium]|nr:adenylate/guanylate cyclase domain-containing protein [Woeseiaceae bacterium]